MFCTGIAIYTLIQKQIHNNPRRKYNGDISWHATMSASFMLISRDINIINHNLLHIRNAWITHTFFSQISINASIRKSYKITSSKKWKFYYLMKPNKTFLLITAIYTKDTHYERYRSNSPTKNVRLRNSCSNLIGSIIKKRREIL